MKVREWIPGDIIQKNARADLNSLDAPRRPDNSDQYADAYRARLQEKANSESVRWKKVEFQAGGPCLDLIDPNPADAYAKL